MIELMDSICAMTKKRIHWAVYKLLAFPLLLIVVVPIESFSQQKTIRFQHLTIDDGLSQNSITCIIQDKRGFLWMGTQYGLNRYDGYEFTVYNWDTNDSSSLSSNYISALYEDSNGYLWIGTGGSGLNKFDPYKEKVTRYTNNQNEIENLNDNFINVLFEDSKGNFWVGTSGGLNRFDKQSGRFLSFKSERWKDSGLESQHILSIEEDKEGNIWVGTLAGGLIRLSSMNDSIYRYKHEPNNSNSLGSNDVWSLLADSKGALWVGTRGGGLSKYNKKRDSFTSFRKDSENPSSLSHNFVYAVIEEDENHLWVGTLGGLDKFDKRTGTFFKSQYQRDNPSGLNNNSIMTIVKDDWGDVWIGTMGGGVNWIGRNTEIFNLYQNKSSNPLSLSDNSLWSIYEDNSGAIWIGTQNGGLNKFDRHKMTFDKSSFISKTLNQSGQLYILSILEDSRGYIWVGTHGGGLFRFDPGTKEYQIFVNDPDNPNSISSNRIWNIHEDSTGKIWLGADEGINVYLPVEDHFLQPQEIDGGHGRVYAILEESNGDIWIGNWGGDIRKFNKQSSKFENVIQGSTKSHGVEFNLILSILEDRIGNIWACGDFGLLKYDKRSNEVTVYTEKDGLPNNLVYGILEDQKGFLWVSTNNGLSRMDPENIEFKNFSKMDGLQGDEFNAGAYEKDSNGNMYFGGTEGLTVFNPEQIVANNTPLTVVLIDFLLFNESVNPDDDSKILASAIDFQDEIRLNHKQYIFAFEFAAINYQQSEKIKYAYMLEPFNQDWIYTDYTDRKAVFTNVPAGEYTFRVKAANADGYWNEQSKNIRVTIYPPWWLTTWAKVLFVVGFLSLSIGFYKWRTSELKRQKRELEKKVEERTTELADKNRELSDALDDLESTQQHLIRSEKMASLGIISSGIAHEINNPLNFIHGGISGLTNKLKMRPNDEMEELTPFIDSIEEGVKRATKIVKSLTQFSRQGGTEFESCDLHQVIDNCLEILQGNLKNKLGIQKNFTNVPFTFIGNEAKLHQAIINVLTNSNHAIDENGTIEINTRIENGKIELLVKDSGIGIKKEDLKKVTVPFYTTKNPGEGTGLGLYITYNIINEFDGDIEIVSELGLGTEVHISLPLI